MLKAAFRRLWESIPLIVIVVTFVFFLMKMIPGDPVELMLGDTASAADRDHLRKLLGLDRPLLAQYLKFWKDLFVGGWGQSISHSKSVLSLILDKFAATLILALSSLSVALFVSFPFGVWAAKKRGSIWDSAITILSLSGMSLPIFVVAPGAILLFSIRLRWLPVSGTGSILHLVLPSLCLGFGLSGVLMRMLRASMLDHLNEDYVRTARSKGLSETRVLFSHVLSNALLPVVTVLGGMLGSLLAGAVVTESLFDWPGIGKLFFSAFQSRDYPLVQGIVLWIAMSYVGIHLVMDLAYAWLDPRIRSGGEAS